MALLTSMGRMTLMGIIMLGAYTFVLIALIRASDSLLGQSSSFSPSVSPSPCPLPFIKTVVPWNGKKLKMLFFTHGYNYETGMDRFFFTHYYGLRNHPWIEPKLWGIGIDGYDTSKTIRENLMAVYGSIYFDVIYLYGMAHNHQLKEISQETIVLVRENECWARRCLRFFTNNGAKISMFNFAPEILQYMDLSNESLLVHTPQTSEPATFYRPAEAPRDIGVLVVGKADSVVYPLRTRFKKLAEDGKIPQSYMRTHPGYFAKGWDASFWYNYTVNMTLVEISDNQVVDYADEIKRAKICVFDGSVYKYAIQKYTEVPMAGCLAIADIPHERMDEFREGMVEVTNDMTDEELISTIQYWLDHEEERIAKAKRGQANAMKYTIHSWGDKVIESVNRIQRQGFGVVMDHQFELSCTADAIPLGLFNNSYCRG